MRGFLVFVSAAGVIGLAYWAYSVNHATQQALAQKRALEREIVGLDEAIDVQQAEWAYLNRPGRLRELAEANFDDLELIPMQTYHFSHPERIPYPGPELDLSGPPEQVMGALEDGQ